MSAFVTADLDGLQNYFTSAAPALVNRSARLAINQVADRRALTLAKERILAETAFAPGYLDREDRLGVTRRATDANLRAIITGRHRPTSLASFAAGTPETTRGKPLNIRVNPSRSQTLRQAFLIRLRAGRGPVTAENSNVGLAVRLRPGEVLDNKTEMVPFGKGGLYLLYGPSVDQVFRTVAGDIAPEIGNAVASEFLRQFVRLSKEEGF